MWCHRTGSGRGKQRPAGASNRFINIRQKRYELGNGDRTNKVDVEVASHFLRSLASTRQHRRAGSFVRSHRSRGNLSQDGSFARSITAEARCTYRLLQRSNLPSHARTQIDPFRRAQPGRTVTMRAAVAARSHLGSTSAHACLRTRFDPLDGRTTRGIAAATSSCGGITQSETALLSMLFERRSTWPTARIVGNVDRPSLILIVSCTRQRWRDKQTHCFNVDRDQFEIEQRMQIGAEKQSIGGVIRFLSPVRNNVSCVENGLQVATCNGAPAVVRCHQVRPKGRLAPTPHDGGKRALACVDNPRRVEDAFFGQPLCGGIQGLARITICGRNAGFCVSFRLFLSLCNRPFPFYKLIHCTRFCEYLEFSS